MPPCVALKAFNTEGPLSFSRSDLIRGWAGFLDLFVIVTCHGHYQVLHLKKTRIHVCAKATRTFRHARYNMFSQLFSDALKVVPSYEMEL